ncbi:MAG: hypothetical protein M3N39_14465 [Pseudomonadota bacterium]|nr:hypothetical protein [Pseudomonadota bacterium]
MTNSNVRLGAGFTLSLLLAGCAATPGPRQSAAAAPSMRPVVSAAGLQAVMGRTAAMLAAQFGRADLDVREGSARKLQFVGPACVLDTYLYPPAGGGEPIVTHVDARLPDGRDMDRASCIAALQAGQKPAR